MANYEFFIEFKSNNGLHSIKEVLFKDHFYKTEQFSLKLFSF